MKFAVVGCGAHATGSHGPALARYAREHAEVELAACCDLDAERAHRFQDRFGFQRSYTDVTAMVEDERPDAALVAVLPEAICAVAAPLLQRGTPLLIEKPPGLTVAEVDRLIAAAREGGKGGAAVPHQVGFNRRFVSLVREARARLTAAGPVQHVRYEMVRHDRREPDFSTTAVHGLDAVRFLAGSDYAQARLRYQELPHLGPGVANMFVDAVMVSGAVAHLAFSPVAGVILERATVHAEGHTLLLQLPVADSADIPGRLLHMERGRVVAERSGVPADLNGEAFELAGFYAQYEAFLGDLDAGRTPSPSLGEARQSVELADALRRRAADFVNDGGPPMTTEVFVPDGLAEADALSRTTHMGVVAHPDDLEILAQPGILECFGRKDRWFCGVVVTDGAGSPRSGPYASVGDREMVEIRRHEQRKAAVVGEFGAAAMIGVSSAEVKAPGADGRAGARDRHAAARRAARGPVHAQPGRPARHARGGRAAHDRGLPRAAGGRAAAAAPGRRGLARPRLDGRRGPPTRGRDGAGEHRGRADRRLRLADHRRQALRPGRARPPASARDVRRVAPHRHRRRGRALHGHDAVAARRAGRSRGLRARADPALRRGGGRAAGAARSADAGYEVTRPRAAASTAVVAAFFALAAPVRAEDAPTAEMLRVLDVVEPGPRITPYLQHQLELAWRQDDRRRAAFEAVRSEADLQALRATIRAKVLEIIGGLPATRTPLNARVTGTIPMDGYRIEKVLFESLPGLQVTALLYVPDGPPGTKRPGVLVACGHSPDGKSFRNYQEISGQLAKRGYVVLSWDPVGQGERSQYWDAARGRSRYNLVCGEHAVLGNLACAAGSSLVRYMVWDGMRALDYLLTRPEVDPARLGVTGTSGGGFQSLYLGALDERIGVVAPSCFVTSLPMRMANRIFEDPDSDPEQDPYRLVSAGVDHAGLLLLIYPRPFVVAAAVNDFFPIEGARKTFREVSALYAARGRGERVSIAEGVHRHQFSPENRRAAFAVFDRVNGLPERPLLDTVRMLDPAALRVTRSGQVRVDLPGRSLPEVIRDDFRGRRPRPALRMADLYLGEGYPGIASWPVVEHGGTATAGAIAWEAKGGFTVDGVRVNRYALHHSRRLVIPVLHVHRPGAAAARTVLDVALAGKVSPADWAEIRGWVGAGDEVLSFDLRGAGETRMRFRTGPADDPLTAQVDDLTAYASPISGVLANHVYNTLLTGRPHFLEMIEDIEIVARFARDRLLGSRLVLRARGEAGALVTAASEAVPGLEAMAPATRYPWLDVVEELREVWPIQYLLPGGAFVSAADKSP